MKAESAVPKFAELIGGNIQFLSNLVDHGARAARAFVVHHRDFLSTVAPRPFLENDYFTVLPAELDNRVRFRIVAVDNQRDRVDLLHETRAKDFGEVFSARASHKNLCVAFRHRSLALDPREKLTRFVGKFCLVTGIVPPNRFIGGFVDDYVDQLDELKAQIVAGEIEVPTTP